MGAATHPMHMILGMLILRSAFCERDMRTHERNKQGAGSLQAQDEPLGTNHKGSVHSFQFKALAGLEGDFMICQPNQTALDSDPALKWHPTTLETLPFLDETTEGVYEYAFVGSTAFASSSTGEKPKAKFGFCYRLVEQHSQGAVSVGQFLVSRCLCGDLGLKGNSPRLGDDVAERLRLKGCREPEPLTEAIDGVGTQLSIDGASHRIVWQHPDTFVVELNEGSWCKMDIEADSWASSKDSSLAHMLPYCMMSQWVTQNHMRLAYKMAEGKSWIHVALHLFAAALYDHQHSNGWFASSQVRYKLAWKSLAESFDTLLSGAPYLEALRTGPGTDATKLEQVLSAGKHLCSQMSFTSPDAFEETRNLFKRYIQSVTDENRKERTIFGHPIDREFSPVKQPQGRKPLFLIVGGPPSSGKSLTSMSPKDFELIQEMTSQGAFGSRSWEELQSSIVELNVDRIVEATDLMKYTKDTLATEKRWAKSFGVDDADLTKRQAGDQQRQYWFLRKKAGIDDISNAYIQYNLAMGYDVIYETLLGDGWLSWALEFEIPKARAAGYQVVLINYVVPVETLVMRAFNREKATGQTAAPAKQIENDAVAAPTNFINPDLLDTLDYAISMTHVKFGEDYEDVLAVFQNKDGNNGCFTHCADSGLLERVDAKVLQRCHMAMCG